MTKIAMGIEYDGASFYGWQKQNDFISVQEELELAIAKVADHGVRIFCAGRTDRGVHATGQVVHFESDAKRDARGWLMGTNMYLSDNVRVIWVKEVPDTFHARFSALARRYKYFIYSDSIRPALLMSKVTWCYKKLDCDIMQRAADGWLGKHDFASFQDSRCGSPTSVRTLQRLDITRSGPIVMFDIVANAFLHHMVRNMVGTLVKVGSGVDVGWAKDVLEARDRRAAGVTMAPNGLYLVDVFYPDEFEIKTGSGPWFFNI